MSNGTEIKNATIRSTSLGREDHSIMTAFIHLDYGGTGQGFGGWAFDEPAADRAPDSRRRGAAFGCDFILRVLEVLEIETWEKLPGTSCRVEASSGKVHRIGHYLKDQWFDPRDIGAS